MLFPKKGIVRYTERQRDGEDFYAAVYAKDDTWTNMASQAHEVDMQDIRPVQDQLSLQTNGFNLFDFKVPDLDFDNKEEVQKVYYPLAEKLLKEASGATRVHIFDTTVRRGNVEKLPDRLELRTTRVEPGTPSMTTHNDYTENSGYKRLEQLLPEDAEKLKQKPFAIWQIWKPIKPVKSSPLGLVDATSVDKADFAKVSLRFPDGREGEVYTVCHNEKHKWYSVDAMQPEEAFCFVVFDSRQDRARFVPHGAWRDPNMPEGAPPRESIELRAYLFFDN